MELTPEPKPYILASGPVASSDADNSDSVSAFVDAPVSVDASEKTDSPVSDTSVQYSVPGIEIIPFLLGSMVYSVVESAAPRSASKRKQALGLTNRLKAFPSPLTSQLPIHLAWNNASPQAPLHAQRTVNVVILLSVLSLGLVSFLSMVFDLPFQTGFSKCY